MTALLGFMAGWGEYITAQTVLFTEDKYTSMVGLIGLQTDYSKPWGWFAVGAIFAMVPVMFVGMGSGVSPQAAFEWIQKNVLAQYQPAQLMPPQGAVSPESRRESQTQSFSHYQPSTGVPPPASSSAQGATQQAGFLSPRARVPTMGHPLGPPGSNLPSLNTSVQSAPGVLRCVAER